MDLYLRCAAMAWAPGFGDRDTYGVVMTFVYLTAAALAVVVAMRGPFRGPSPAGERWIWSLGAAMLVALALNKQLDLQTMLVTAARCLAEGQGWYNDRREVQTRVIVGLVVAVAVLVPVTILLLRRSIAGNLAFVLSMTALVGFVVLRAISFHHLDELFAKELMSLRLHRIIEVASLGMVILASAVRLRRSKTISRSPQQR